MSSLATIRAASCSSLPSLSVCSLHERLYCWPGLPALGKLCIFATWTLSFNPVVLQCTLPFSAGMWMRPCGSCRPHSSCGSMERYITILLAN